MSHKEKRKFTPQAAALKYIPGRDRAPRVTAKGSGILAQRIIELAQKNGIPIKEDPALVEILAQLDFYQEIPPSIYVVVAEILAFVYSMNNRWRNSRE